jgi:hypothetical protein
MVIAFVLTGSFVGPEERVLNLALIFVLPLTMRIYVRPSRPVSRGFRILGFRRAVSSTPNQGPDQVFQKPREQSSGRLFVDLDKSGRDKKTISKRDTGKRTTHELPHMATPARSMWGRVARGVVGGLLILFGFYLLGLWQGNILISVFLFAIGASLLFDEFDDWSRRRPVE